MQEGTAGKVLGLAAVGGEPDLGYDTGDTVADLGYSLVSLDGRGAVGLVARELSGACLGVDTAGAEAQD